MEIIVSSSGALVSAVLSAHSGDTILLSAGSYSALGLQNINFAGAGVTIASANPDDPATVAGVEIAGSSGLTFRDLEVTINSRTQTAFNVVGSSNIRLDGLNMHGADGGGFSGLLFRNSTNVTVNDTDFHDLGTGVRNVDSTQVTVSNNRFEDMRGDGIQTTGSSNVTLDGNHFTNFHVAPGDHPDAIQFFTANQTAPAHDIVITDNVVIRGSGDIIQGIFMGNEAGQPYIGVTISGNVIVGAMYNGIAIGYGQNISITDNIVQAYADQPSGIRIEGSSNATIANNQSQSLQSASGNTGLTLSGNTSLAATSVGDLGLAKSALAADAMYGTGNADTLTGSLQDDHIWGGAGNDSLSGGSGQNFLRGEDGNDTLAGGSGFDDMHGNTGDDVLYGAGGADWVVGGKGNDQLNGGDGGDLVYGNLGDDVCDGGDGADTLTGGQENDVLKGGAGADYLSGDRGSDTMTGGAGADIFHTNGQAGLDWVSDFNAAEGDRVMLDPGTHYAISQAGADTIITMEGGGGTIVLAGVSYASLQSGWLFGA